MTVTVTAPATEIEIFRAGTHTDVAGQTIAFSEADLAATARAYDPAVHEAPIVVGHPTLNAPAYGWIGGLTAAGPSLVAAVGQLDAAFAEAVRSGRYKKISAAFYPPDAAGNPTPGVYALRHVGFLGAAPPAVKGLRPVAFADDGAAAVTVELAPGRGGAIAFGELEGRLGWVLRLVASALRGVREYVVAAKGPDAADQVVSGWQLDQLVEEAGRIEGAADAAAPGFAEPGRRPAHPPEPQETSDVTAPNAAEIERRAAELERDRQALAAQQVAFAEQQRQARRRDDEVFLDQLVRQGRPLPVDRAEVLAFMATLHGGQALAFAEGRTEDPAAFFRRLLGKLPQSVDFAERAAGTGGGEDPAHVAEAKLILAAGR